MAAIEISLFIIEVLLWVALILFALILIAMLYIIFKLSKQAPEGEGEQGNGCVQTIHPKSGT